MFWKILNTLLEENWSFCIYLYLGNIHFISSGYYRGWGGWTASLTQWHEFEQACGDTQTSLQTWRLQSAQCLQLTALDSAVHKLTAPGGDWRWWLNKVEVQSLVSQFSSVQLSCPTLCNLMDCSTPGLPVLHQLPELAQTHVHHVSGAIQPSHPLSSPSPPTFNLSQYQSLFKWVSSLHQVAEVLEFQLQHQSFQWIFRIDLL